ncbi:MAG TPA: hypothetical protein VFN23_11335 [Ktedonobacteraceae bacterium]|nr:hypothetical protein [Ktedonobacteraceae bacterium]
MKTTPNIMYFTLPGLLPENDDLALNTQFSTLTHFSYREGRLLILAEEQFESGELRLIEAILNAYPHYCPNEVLLANCENLTDEFSVQYFRRKLKQAILDGSYMQYVQPLKLMLIAISKKLGEFNLGLYCLLETGYVLRKGNQEVTRKTVR